MNALRERFPEGWQRLSAEALAADEYFYVLLWKGSFDEASRFAERVADRLAGLKADALLWVERQGDAAFLAGNPSIALQRYEAVRGAVTLRQAAVRRPWLLLKMSDAQFRLGNLEGERACREAIYGSLHEEQDHPEEVTIGNDPKAPQQRKTPDDAKEGDDANGRDGVTDDEDKNVD